MNAHKKIVFGVLALCTFLVACVPVFYFPDSGTWYCEELQAQFVADTPDDFNPLNNDESGIYVIVDGDQIACVIDLERHSTHFAFMCQETDNAKFELGETIYELEIVSLSEMEYVLEDETGKRYTFVRID
jgi:hypothetical protein